MNNNKHLNYIILHDGSEYSLFERLGKNVPFDAYNKESALVVSDSVDEILKICRIKNLKKSETDLPKNWGSSRVNFPKKSLPKVFEIEKKPYEVMYNG